MIVMLIRMVKDQKLKKLWQIILVIWESVNEPLGQAWRIERNSLQGIVLMITSDIVL